MTDISLTEINSHRNAAVYERDAKQYARTWALQRPEQMLLKRFRMRWPHIDMLDIGVGAGRTAYTFSAVARSYIGIDYSPTMITLSRKFVGEDETTRFLVSDARNLSSFYGREFNFILFSYNGIDSVDQKDRVKILREVRKIISDDGYFAFSSHSLNALPLSLRLPRLSATDPLRSAYWLLRSAKIAPKRMLTNLRVDLQDARQRGWAAIPAEAHNFELVVSYIAPEFQLAQLGEVGFTDCEVYDLDGLRVDPVNPGRDLWLHYLCRPQC